MAQVPYDDHQCLFIPSYILISFRSMLLGVALKVRAVCWCFYHQPFFILFLFHIDIYFYFFIFFPLDIPHTTLLCSIFGTSINHESGSFFFFFFFSFTIDDQTYWLLCQLMCLKINIKLKSVHVIIYEKRISIFKVRNLNSTFDIKKYIMIIIDVFTSGNIGYSISIIFIRKNH